MRTDDLFRVDIDFKELAEMVWAHADRAEKNPDWLKKIKKKGSNDPRSPWHFLGRMIRSILGGMWTSSEDMAKQMDLNVYDHDKYIELYKILRELE